MNRYDCKSVETVLCSVDAEILMGFDKQARCSDSILLDMVAENRYVVLFGNIFRILASNGPKSRSSSLSASSRTRYFNCRSEKPLVFSKWSSRRPGVATTICGFFPNTIAYETMSSPPINNAERTDTKAPKASTTCEVCCTSSLVGARIRECRGCGLFTNACKIGSTNAAVLPLPVSARPIKSRPCNAIGMDCA